MFIEVLKTPVSAGRGTLWEGARGGPDLLAGAFDSSVSALPGRLPGVPDVGRGLLCCCAGAVTTQPLCVRPRPGVWVTGDAPTPGLPLSLGRGRRSADEHASGMLASAGVQPSASVISSLLQSRSHTYERFVICMVYQERSKKNQNSKN